MEFGSTGKPSLPLKVSNIGVHSATDLRGMIVIANALDGSNLLMNKAFLISNELVQGGLLEMQVTAPNPVAAETRNQLILLALQYNDRILNKKFFQRFYFEWLGVVDGESSPKLTHCQRETKEIESCLRTYLEEFRSWENL